MSELRLGFLRAYERLQNFRPLTKVPTLTNYVAFNGDMSSQHIGFDPHAVMGVVLSNGALISVGSGLSKGLNLIFILFIE